METAIKYVMIIFILIVVTIIIIGLLSVWTGQSSDMASGIVNFFSGVGPDNLKDVLKK
ncbi:MAG: hypothetical protein NTU57_05215 [Candidatus Aenigmarchaeota archaeon]|nr:hypothetical protein [Candidatus Aenigmarchaeota archaeon]